MESPLTPFVEDIRKSGSWIVKLKGCISTDDIKDPETDLHIAYGSSWQSEEYTFQKNIQKEGLSLWN